MDFYLFEFIEFATFLSNGDLFKKYHKAEEYHNRIASLPKLKEYLASEHCLKRPFNGATASVNN